MKRTEQIEELPLPEDFGTVIAETSHVDLRRVPSGSNFVGVEQATANDLNGTLLVVASTPEFLRTALELVNGAESDLWVMLADTGAASLADMLNENEAWTVTARAITARFLAFRVRPSRSGDRDLADVITGLRLATALDALRPEQLTTASVRPVAPDSMTLLIRVKRRIPRRAKTLVKKALARK